LNKIVAAVLLIIIAGALYAGYVLLKPPSETRIVIAGVTLYVEIASTSAQQQAGLSNRDSMAQDHGMLFVFGSEGEWGFWMKDMKFSLDIIWFDSQKNAVFIEQSLLPCTPQDCPVHTPPVKAMYVLEVNAGFVQAHGITVGDMFSFAG
jgi:uncharacterized membrane protein (UPF0127 family)